MKKLLLSFTGLLLVFGFVSVVNAEVNADTPSTNDENRTNGWAHVNQLTQDVGETELEFVSTRNFYSCFEYRTDGDTSQATGNPNYNPVFPELYPYVCVINETKKMTFSADEYVEVRMVFGAETDERFDWTRFDVLYQLKGKDVQKATGGIWMSGPKQQMQFNAFDQGSTMFDKGQVEYWNYDYPGGVLNYTADVMCASVDEEAGTARFMFQIPEGWPGLSGLYVVSAVSDGGTPGTNGDTYGHAATSDLNTATQWCEGVFSPSPYLITAGNLVVHK